MVISILSAHRSTVAAVLLALSAALGSAPLVAEDSMAERLQRLEDKEAIRDLLERFFEYQETQNFEAFANTFAQDGEMYLRVGHTTGGPKGILASMNRRPNRANDTDGDEAAKPRSRNMRHVLSNVHIELNGDTATAKSRWTMLIMTEDNRARVGGTGEYCDKLVRENGEWKFQQRVIYCEIPDYGKLRRETPPRE